MKKALVLVIGLLFFEANAYAANGDLVVNGNVTVSGTVNGAATKLTDGTNIIHTQIVNIGDWNMDTTDFVVIATGVSPSKIRGVGITIRADTGIPLYGVSSYYSPDVSWSIQSPTNYFILSRKIAGVYDSAIYNDTSYNRGWLTITYVE